jgi:short-subunit dehydrogenase
MDIKNKVIVITGASEGIGLATARVLAREGAKLVLAARSADSLKKLEKELDSGRHDGKENASGAIAVPTDMRKPADIATLVDAAVKKFGRIDVLINNAGQGMYGPVESIDIDKYKDIMELNVFAVLRAMQAVIPIMRKQGGGMILNISSRVSKNYYPNLAAYASTKYALNAISLTARAELEKDNIVISVFHPKMTATNFGKNSVSASARPLYDNSSRPASAPARPAGMEVDTPEQVAEQIAEQIQSEAPEAEM